MAGKTTERSRTNPGLRGSFFLHVQHRKAALDAPIPAGRIGFGVDNATARFDDVTVTAK